MDVCIFAGMFSDCPLFDGRRLAVESNGTIYITLEAVSLMARRYMWRYCKLA